MAGPREAEPVPPDLRDPGTPEEVIITLEARVPVADPALGVPVAVDGSGAKHRLVSIGDSLTHGFQSLAIFNTDLSYPALIARELGCYRNFLHPEYPGLGGLPLNLEYVAHQMQGHLGAPMDWRTATRAIFFLRHLVNEIETYWEQGAGRSIPPAAGIHHNLGIYGWDVRDVLSKTADSERTLLGPLLAGGPTTVGLNPFSFGDKIKRYMDICGRLAAIRVLDSARSSAGAALTPVRAAREIGKDGGIETLTVFIGANNALRTVLELGPPKWSGDGYDDAALKDAFTVWRPSHFLSEYTQLVDQISDIEAAHVIFCSVPHITIAPLARGVGEKQRPGSRFFEHYTRPWISDEAFDPKDDLFLTGNQARAVDSAVDQYNYGIEALVLEGRQSGRDWLFLDTAGLLDRLAHRRYIQDPAARPAWWTPYTLPPALAVLDPTVDSQFFATGADGVRLQGGLIALDGVHPTTAGYGLLAQELMKVMELAGVVFRTRNTEDPRPSPVQLDFDWLLGRDTLLTDPPALLQPELTWLGWLDEVLEVTKRFAAH